MPDADLGGETLLGLLARFDGHSALIAPRSGVVLSHARMHEQTGLVASQLRSLGVSSGALVAMALANGRARVVGFLAVVSLGAAVAPINPALSEAEIAADLDDLGVILVLHRAPASAASCTAAGAANLACYRLEFDSDALVVVEGAHRSPALATCSVDGDPAALAFAVAYQRDNESPENRPTAAAQPCVRCAQRRLVL